MLVCGPLELIVVQRHECEVRSRASCPISSECSCGYHLRCRLRHDRLHYGPYLGLRFAPLRRQRRIAGIPRGDALLAHIRLHVPLPHAFIEHLLSTCRDAPFSASIEDRTLFFIDLSVYGARPAPAPAPRAAAPPPRRPTLAGGTFL